ncbi:MAG: Lrp/AsnC family transcriptional regulator [Proteobacteria bacterium]|nr:MAG: Lrp/AsnC family transcriptional regulator [Pseudomonadota bacterium]
MRAGFVSGDAEVIKLDARDLRILAVLQEEGRISNRDLAMRVGLSPSSCLVRVRRLEKSRVIRAYNAKLDLSRVSSSVQCIALIKLAHHGSGAFQHFVREVKRLPEIVECLMLSGQYDFMVRTVCRDIARYNALNDRLLSLGVGVESIGSYIVMEESKGFTNVSLDTLIDDPPAKR